MWTVGANVRDFHRRKWRREEGGMLAASVVSKIDNGALHEFRVPTNLFFRLSLYRLQHQSFYPQYESKEINKGKLTRIFCEGFLSC